MSSLPHDSLFSRRDLLKLTALSAAGFSFGNQGIGLAHAAEVKIAPAAASALPPLNRFPQMVQEYFVERVREVERGADRRRTALQTKQDAENYVLEVRAKIQQCFGPWPEKTPLNARVTGAVERDAYTIEKVIFESRPGFPVTAAIPAAAR